MGTVTTHTSVDANSSKVARVILYPNTESARWGPAAQDGLVTNQIESSFERLHNNDAITGYEIWLWLPDDYDTGNPSYPEVTEEDFSSFQTNMIEYIQDTEFAGTIGVHFGVSDSVSGGGGDSVKYDESKASNSAFNLSPIFTIGTNTSYADKARNFSIQEPIHGFMASQELLEHDIIESASGNYHDDHKTGIVRGYQVTPMATTHAEDVAGDSNCDRVAEVHGYDPYLTDCTIEGVKHTAEDA